MSANVETMMYAGAVPWHGQGTYVGQNNVNSKTAIVAAGLDWDVLEKPLYFNDTSFDASFNVTNTEIKVPTHKALVRSTDNKVLGVVGSGFVPMQNRECFAFMDGLIDSGEMRYHTAGALKGGKQVWILAQIGRVDIVKNDPQDQFVMLLDGKDGSGALRGLPTAIRVVCANTVALALNRGKGNKSTFSIRHTTNMKDRLEQAKDILIASRVENIEYTEWCKWTATKKLTTAKVQETLDTLFPVPAAVTKWDEKKRKTVVVNQRSITMAMNNQDTMRQLFEDGRGQDNPHVRGTGWAMWNAVTEYANYHSNVRGGTQFDSLILGSSGQFIQSAKQKLSKLIA